jgi:chemotaxis protein histidine kinase CheA/CheY-like chemotaxis protein
MDERFYQKARSADELAILQAFDAMDLGNMEGDALPLPTNAPDDVVQPPLMPLSSTSQADSGRNELHPYVDENEMLALFVVEVNDDIQAMRHVLHHIELEEQLNPDPLQAIQRLAHKIKGTSGSIGCVAMSTIAYYIEELTKQIAQGVLVPFIGLPALAQSIYALEMTLNSMVTYGTEREQPLADLEAEYRAINIDIQDKPDARGTNATGVSTLHTSDRQDTKKEQTPQGTREEYPYHRQNDSVDALVHGRGTSGGYPAASTSVRVDVRRFEQLVLHTGELAELQASMQNAQAEVEQALQELHAAHARLRHVEALVATNLFARNSNSARQSVVDERPTSSLVARILDEAAQRTGHSYQRKSKYAPTGDHEGRPYAGWDALEMDHFTENDVLIHSLDEAIADVVTATARLRLELTHLNHITREHMAQATHVRNDTLLLRLTPLSSLVSRVERAVTMSTVAQGRRVRFESEGGTTEIDQDILEELKQPLLQLVRTCLAQSYYEQSQHVDPEREGERIWLYVRAFGNEVVVELGFSMTVGGGGLDGIQEALHRLNGSVTIRQNTYGGITFVLRLPRAQGAQRCLLVRGGSHRVVVPFAQVQRIDDGKDAIHTGEERYSLYALLGFPPEQDRRHKASLSLLVQSNSTLLVVEVDEILGDVELVVKPLAPHLQRPGIAGTVIDGMSNVLLVVDIPELVRHYKLQRPESRTGAMTSKQKMYEEQTPLTVMVADDSVYIRQSVRHTLSRAGYRVIEAEDGMKALELLVDQPPDALVLDMEMPNLNGYDVLSMIHVHPELANVKVVMLTSRSSEKHQARARELGAHSYLTKPCPEETLLSTLHKLLTS